MDAKPRPKGDLATRIREASSRWPGISLDASEFAAWMATRVRGGDLPDAVVELALVFACTRGDPVALARFQSDYVQVIVERGAELGFSVDPDRLRQATLAGFDGSISLGKWMPRAHGVWPWIRAASAPRTLDNADGEGIVSIVEGGEWTYARGIRVLDQTVFEYGNACGTCGILFRKVADPAARVTDDEAVALVGSLEALPSEAVLRRLARILDPARYLTTILEVRVRWVDPRDPAGSFASEVREVFGAGDDTDPGTPYYRLQPVGADCPSGLAAVAVPLHDPASLDAARVAFWRSHLQAGAPATALALTVLDVQQVDSLLTSVLLDGHHRFRAAAELGLPVRILSFVHLDGCFEREPEDLGAALAVFERRSAT